MPLALLTNDDGIDSYFMRVLAKALAERFEVVVAAPKREQSWIGRAMSRHNDVTVEQCPDLPCEGWCVDGTPTDCVNIALEHLLTTPPDIVVSGINIGFNTTLPLILSSGTVGGAIEGAVWGHRALAVSQVVPREHFELIRQAKHSIPADMCPSLEIAAVHAAQLALTLLDEPAVRLQVHNLNYPYPVHADTPLERTVPSDAVTGGLFAPDPDDPGVYRFQYRYGELLPSTRRTDRACLSDGHISHSLIDLSRLGLEQGVESEQ